MYDRSNIQRAASHSYPSYAVTTPTTPKQYPSAHSTSSAFSASANPNEDWTKISDLAERRRIQNRIAQRNYRKKLKKRLEDLERRAGSSSASPEPRPEELPPSETASSSVNGKNSSRRKSSTQIRREPSYEELQPQYVLPEDRGMFSQQYTRQLSTSPPPFSYASMSSTESASYPSTYPPTAGYYSLSGSGAEMSMYPQYVSAYPQQSYQSVVSSSGAPIKQELYNDDEMSPFSMSYANMGGVDVSAASSYHNMAAYVSTTRNNRVRAPSYHAPQPAAAAAAQPAQAQAQAAQHAQQSHQNNAQYVRSYSYPHNQASSSWPSHHHSPYHHPHANGNSG